MVAPNSLSPSYTAISPIDPANLAEEIREAERRDIARELHDTVIQPLASLAMSFDSVQYQPLTAGMLEAYVGAWKELAQEALDSLRCTLTGLRTHPHAQLGILEALHRYLAPQLRSRGLRLAIESHGWPDDLPIDWTSTLYLAIREALTNVEKHAHASEVTVLLRADGQHLYLAIADNGVGLREGEAESEATKRSGSGFGLVGIRERLRVLNGSMTVMSAPGQGVQLAMQLPYCKDVHWVPDAVTELPHETSAHITELSRDSYVH